jgi:hypothetical protein
MRFAGGREEQITTAGGSLAQESFDGRTLYYALTNSPLSTLMEIPVGGGKGRPLDITFTARAFQVLPDGIYFIAPPDSTLAGPNWGISQWVGHAGPFGYSSQLRNGSRRFGARGYAAIQFYDFATENVRELHRLRGRLGLGRGISVSPDRKTFLYSTDEGTGWDLMLVDNFR